MKRKINNVDILILVCSCLFVILTCMVLSNKFILIDSYFQSLMLNIACNAYFFLFWGIIIYFTLKLFNRIWERFF